MADGKESTSHEDLETTKTTFSGYSSDEELDIESLRIEALEIAKRVINDLGGLGASINLEFVAHGGYNYVWLLTYLSVSILSYLYIYVLAILSHTGAENRGA